MHQRQRGERGMLDIAIGTEDCAGRVPGGHGVIHRRRRNNAHKRINIPCTEENRTSAPQSPEMIKTGIIDRGNSPMKAGRLRPTKEQASILTHITAHSGTQR